MSVSLWTRGRPVGIGHATVIGRVGPTPGMDACLLTDQLRRESSRGSWAAILTTATPSPSQLSELGVPVVHSIASLAHLSEGDVVALDSNGDVRTLYRRESRHNTLLVTERCNSFCIMCSQPPRRKDRHDILEENLRVLELADPDTEVLGISGGEPTLFKEGFLTLVERAKNLLPCTALHVLTNGRLFYYGSYARDVASLAHPDLMMGVPLYADTDSAHDHVVQARGAFDQTLAGLHNLARWGVPVEVRVVLHKYTYRRLPHLAGFITRNLPFAAQVALMGLEPMGFAIGNLDDLWVDPSDYLPELAAATRVLANAGMQVLIYNHQLCILPRELWEFAVPSISDWKNEYLPACYECAVRDQCGGFFTSSVARRTSGHISPVVR